MLRRNIIASIAAILLLFASAYADLNETIYIEIVGQGKFEVIYHRALTNQTGAALGGIIGMSIQSGIEADRDASKRKELEPLIQKDTWKIRFLDTLNNKLESNGHTAVWVEDDSNIGDGIVLRIYPDVYGFKMVDTSTRKVSAFIDFKAAFSNGNNKNQELEGKEAYYLTHRNQYQYDDLLKEDSPVNSDLQAVLEKAAKRLANKIIYSAKE